MIPLLAGAAKFMGGTGGIALVAGLVGMGVGAWGAGVFNDATQGKQYRVVSVQSSKALVTLVQNAGRREMNYLWRAEAERGQCRAMNDTFAKWDQLSVEAKAAARAQAVKLNADLKILSDNYSNLVASYEGADKTTTGWLNGDVDPSLCIVRWGAKACRSDPFAAAGYPEPPAAAGPVAKPAGGSGP